jgi:hypothetical protein
MGIAFNLKPLPGPPYRDPVANIYYTQALFHDFQFYKAHSQQKYDPVFTLHVKRPGYICCRDTFLELRDPTGYTWAMTYLKDFQHFRKLLSCPWFVAALRLWQEELDMILESESTKRIIAIAGSENEAQALAAAKYLNKKEYKEKHTVATGRGRPSKATVDAAVKEEAQKRSVEDDDMERLGLRIVKGGKD